MRYSIREDSRFPLFGLNCTNAIIDVVKKLYEKITLENFSKIPQATCIDVRSPLEYQTGHIPGAINIPILSNHEREQVGTVYKQQGPAVAKELGLSLVAPKLPSLLKELQSHAAKSKQPLVVYCWRGGLRSRSLVTVAALMGIACYQLQEGYKAYRHDVLERLQHMNIQPKLIVLCGSTGAGKTAVLKALAARNIPTLNLEQLANHRGSVFGHIGLGTPTTAQNFDSLLLQQLESLQQSPYIVVECESKRIGNVYLPHTFYQALQQGQRILLTASLENRVARLIQEYAANYQTQRAAIQKCLLALERRLGAKKMSLLLTAAENDDLQQITRMLVTDYYDPLYGYETANPAKYQLTVSSDDVDQAASQIIQYLERN